MVFGSFLFSNFETDWSFDNDDPVENKVDEGEVIGWFAGIKRTVKTPWIVPHSFNWTVSGLDLQANISVHGSVS